MPGISEETYPCNTHYCQLPGKHLWSAWSECSAKCGRGEQTRHTMCGKIKKKRPMKKKKKDRGKGESLKETFKITLIRNILTNFCMLR